MSCENGQAISIYGEMCNKSEECPISDLTSKRALESNCSYSSNHFCPIYYTSSKICMDKVDVSITDYCTYYGQAEPWNCPKANKGLKFDQCYSM